VVLANKFNKLNQESLNQEFLKAVELGNIERVKELVKKGANLNTRNPQGETSLLWATKEEQTGMALVLIAQKASLNAQDDEGNTALLTACRNGNIEIARALIDADADISVENKQGEKAFNAAMKQSQPELVGLFEKPLKKILMQIPSAEIARAIQYHNVNPNEQNPQTGETMLNWASGAGLMNVTLAFVQAGADQRIPNKDGQIAAEAARSKNHTAVAEILEEGPQTIVVAPSTVPPAPKPSSRFPMGRGS
jgi:hypothetical protein